MPVREWEWGFLQDAVLAGIPGSVWSRTTHVASGASLSQSGTVSRKGWISWYFLVCPWTLPAAMKISSVFLWCYYRLPTQSVLPFSLNYSISLCLRDPDNSRSFLSTTTEMRCDYYLLMFILSSLNLIAIMLLWIVSFCYYDSYKATDEACKPVKQQLLQPLSYVLLHHFD